MSGRPVGSQSRDWSKERAILARVRNRVQKALDDALLDPLMASDLKDLRIGNIKFDADGFRTTLEGTFKAGQNREERAYEDLRRISEIPTRVWKGPGPHDSETIPGFKLPPLFSYVSTNGNGSKVRIIGARDSRAKFNIIVVRADGKRTCYRAEDIARLAAKQGVV